MIFRWKDLKLEERQSPVPEFCWHTSEDLSAAAGAGILDFAVRSLDPGKFSYPYHFHSSSEELFVILSGKAMLRTPEGVSELGKGDLAFFKAGPDGAHQLYNHTEGPCVYLDLGGTAGGDVCEYPDSGKLNITPGRLIFEKSAAVDYYKGEENPAAKWPAGTIQKK